jgi:DNA helicase-2/ATP-dependent DNA helicase PcrA
MNSNLLDGLNEAQQRAVTSTARTILCLAGAGSGKTTVLTRRVANLNQNERIGISNMLCLTFTRLAGKEMK